MFTLNLDNCVRLNKEDKMFFIQSVGDAVRPVIIYWNMDMNVSNGVLGCYSPWYPDSIFLAPYKDCPEMLASTVVHELVHRSQHSRYGFFYHLLSIPVLREYTLEKEAREAEDNYDTQMHVY